jgi:hypothetical protein
MNLLLHTGQANLLNEMYEETFVKSSSFGVCRLLRYRPFFTGVSPQVTLKLVGSRESFAAEQPIANEGALACVPSQMGFEVACLSINLPASGNVTAVDVFLSKMHPGWAKTLGFLTIGAVASCSSRVAAIWPRWRGRCRGCLSGR